MADDNQIDGHSGEAYLERFGLSAAPFQDDSAETLVVCSAPIKESLEQIANKCWYTVEPVLVTSEPFCEKNPLCRVFLNILGEDFAVCHINVDVMTTAETLLNDFAQKLSIDIDPDAFGPTLSQYFAANQDQGKEFAVLVEGVHELSPEAITLLLELVKAEAEAESNLHFVFWGQESLVTMVADLGGAESKFSQIKIPLFTLDEIKAYVSAGLAQVGYSGDLLIKSEDLEEIFNAAAGSLASINVAVELALKNKAEQMAESDGGGGADYSPGDILAGLEGDDVKSDSLVAGIDDEFELEFEAGGEIETEAIGDEALVVADVDIEEDVEADLDLALNLDIPEETADDIIEAVSEPDEPAESGRSFAFVNRFPLRHGVAALVLLLVLGLLYVGLGGDDDETSELASKQPESSGVVVRSVTREPERELEPEVEVPVQVLVNSDSESHEVVSEEEAHEEVLENVLALVEPSVDADAEIEVEFEIEEALVVEEALVAVPDEVVESAVIADAYEETALPLTVLAQQHEKLLAFSDESYFLQLLGSFSEQSAQGFIEANGINDKFYYFKTQYRNRPWFVVVYGNFPSRAEASAAKKNLPESILKAEPWIRNMADIRASIKE